MCFLLIEKNSFFLLWTSRKSIIVKIFRDLNWYKHIETLKIFYFEKYIPYIIGKIQLQLFYKQPIINYIYITINNTNKKKINRRS